MAFIDDVKLSLRISSTTYNTEITDLIAAAKADLKLSGVLDEKVLETDTLIKRAIITYVKANFGWDNPDADRLQVSYQMLKQHITMSSDYAYFALTFKVTDSVSSANIKDAKVVLTYSKDSREEPREEIKYTNASGNAIFYIRAGTNYMYDITASGYESKLETYYDATATATINAALVPL
jgi:uncharacterized phage protein (predicted DNA packaging)